MDTKEKVKLFHAHYARLLHSLQKKNDGIVINLFVRYIDDSCLFVAIRNLEKTNISHTWSHTCIAIPPTPTPTNTPTPTQPPTPQPPNPQPPNPPTPPQPTTPQPPTDNPQPHNPQPTTPPPSLPGQVKEKNIFTKYKANVCIIWTH